MNPTIAKFLVDWGKCCSVTVFRSPPEFIFQAAPAGNNKQQQRRTTVQSVDHRGQHSSSGYIHSTLFLHRPAWRHLPPPPRFHVCLNCFAASCLVLATAAPIGGCQRPCHETAQLAKEKTQDLKPRLRSFLFFFFKGGGGSVQNSGLVV